MFRGLNLLRNKNLTFLNRKLNILTCLFTFVFVFFQDGGPDTGGTLKIYGEALARDVPYKTLLLSVRDTAGYVVEEMLEKYGRNRREAPGFCLAQVMENGLLLKFESKDSNTSRNRHTGFFCETVPVVP